MEWHIGSSQVLLLLLLVIHVQGWAPSRLDTQVGLAWHGYAQLLILSSLCNDLKSLQQAGPVPSQACLSHLTEMQMCVANGEGLIHLELLAS